MPPDQNQPRRVLGEQYYNQVSESIKSIFELSTRIDERVQSLMRQSEANTRIMESQAQATNLLTARVAVLESRKIDDCRDDLDKLEMDVRQIMLQVQELQGNTDRQETRWRGVFGFLSQIAWCLLAGYLLWRLGLQAPP